MSNDISIEALRPASHVVMDAPSPDDAAVPEVMSHDDQIAASRLGVAARATIGRKRVASPAEISFQTWNQHLQHIARNPDAATRNVQITRAYYNLSRQMQTMLGPDSGANWATWATWASKQAGTSIREEDIPGNRDQRQTAALAAGAIDPLTGASVDAFNRLYDASAGKVAEGNQAVFQEIGPEFARFVSTFRDDTRPDPKKFERYASQFEPGNVAHGGQDLLKQAFTSYYQAKFESDPARKQQMVLLGNARIGLHEQTRLQSYIQDALPMGSPLATQTLMSLHLPDETLSLGQDLPRPQPAAQTHGQMFPPGLQTIQNPELQSLLTSVDRTPNTLTGSGSHDWANLGDRMNFIVDLFRSRQMDPALFNQPYNTDELNRLLFNGR